MNKSTRLLLKAMALTILSSLLITTATSTLVIEPETEPVPANDERSFFEITVDCLDGENCPGYKETPGSYGSHTLEIYVDGGFEDSDTYHSTARCSNGCVRDYPVDFSVSLDAKSEDEVYEIDITSEDGDPVFKEYELSIGELPGTQKDNINFAINERSGNDQLRGLGLTNTPFDDPSCGGGLTSGGDFNPGDHEITTHINTEGVTGTTHTRYSPEVGAVLRADFSANVEDIIDSRIAAAWCGDESGDISNWPLNRDVQENPDSYDCDDKYSCDHAYVEEDAYEECHGRRGSRECFDYDFTHWDIEGDVLVTEDKFWLCDSDAYGEQTEVQGDPYICVPGDDEGVTGKWGSDRCYDEAIGTPDGFNEIAAGYWNLDLDSEGTYRDFHQDIDGILSQNDWCEYQDVGDFTKEEVTHPINWEDEQGTYDEYSEPYIFECKYDDYEDPSPYQVSLENFEEERWVNYHQQLGSNYDQLRKDEALQHCAQVGQDADEEFLEEWEGMPVAEFYYQPSTLPLTDQAETETEVNEIQDLVKKYHSDFTGLKHFNFQSIYTAHNYQYQNYQQPEIIDSYRPQRSECGQNMVSTTEKHCMDNWEEMSWERENEEYIQSDSVSSTDLYSEDAEDPAWTVANANAPREPGIATNRELEENKYNADSDKSVLNNEVFPGGFAPKCPPRHKLEMEDGSWTCEVDGIEHEPEIFMPQIEELSYETGDIEVGIFFPPSTFEHYTDEDNVPSERNHLAYGPTGAQKTVTQSVQEEHNLQETPRVRGIDVVCGISEPEDLNPEQVPIEADHKFSVENKQVPRPPEDTTRALEGTSFVAPNAPLPVTGTVNAGEATVDGTDTFTCMWRYRYTHSTQDENLERWFTSTSDARNLACDTPNQAWCTPAVQNPASIQDIAEDRGWETDNLPNGEISTELNQEELQEYQEAWQLTNDEKQQIADAEDQDDIDTDFELGFASDQISRMIEEILAFVQ